MFAPAHRSLVPGGPSPCPRHYSVAFGYYAASVLPPARWHFRAPCWASRWGSSLIPAEDVVAPRSCLLYAGWSTEAVRTAGTSSPATTLPFWSWRLSQFRHMGLTTLQTQVPCVSIGHRVGPLSPRLARRLGPLSAGFPPQGVPLLDAGRLTRMSLLKHGSDEQHLQPLVGARSHNPPAR
jgi:hypothetical protein